MFRNVTLCLLLIVASAGPFHAAGRPEGGAAGSPKDHFIGDLLIDGRLGVRSRDTGDINLVVLDSGVGIGTNRPTQELTVVGIVESTAGGFMFPDGTIQTTSALPGGFGDGHSLDAADGDPVDAVFVDNDGLVGIGTSQPLNLLHIRSNLPGTPGGGLTISGDEGQLSALLADGGTGDPGYLVLYRNGSARVQVSPDISFIETGNVGIGTTSPHSRLEVDNGYLKLDTSPGPPPAEDCDEPTEVGRMKMDEASTDLYVCAAVGWVAK